MKYSEHPAIHIEPNTETEIILLRNIVNNQRILVDYEEDAFTEKLEIILEQLINAL